MVLKVLLIDDNRFALNHFSNLVKWEELGFSLVGTASDGIEGLRMFEEYRPDLIITDVQMPGIDGRELARRVKETSFDTEVIFLSSYDEFDYARAAIDLRVYEYILKQELTSEMLTDKLEKIRDRFREKREWKNQQVKDSLMAYFRMSMKELETEEYREHKLFNGAAGLFFIEQDHVPEQIAVQSGYQVPEADYKFLIGQLCQQLPELAYLIRVDRFLWIGVTEGIDTYENAAGRAKAYLTEHAGESFSVYLCGEVHTVMDCRIRYEQMEYLRKLRYFEGPQCLIRAELSERPGKVPNSRMEELFERADELWSEEREAAEPALTAIFRPLLYQRDFDSFMRMACYLIHGMNERAKGDPSFSLYDEEVLYLLSAKRIVQWIKEKVLLIHGRIYPVYSHITSRVISYISANYANPLLSVEMIAGTTGLSVNRMNDLLKKDLGITAGKYLAEVRAEKARQLLEKGVPIQQVSEQAGYTTSSYFSRVFHKTYGISPQEYQKRRTEKG